MNTNAEKRTYERHCYSAEIAFSYFNKEHSYNAHTLNIGTGGMCFKSNLFLRPGATLYVRLKETHPNSPCSGFCEGLHISRSSGSKMVPRSAEWRSLSLRRRR